MRGCRPCSSRRRLSKPGDLSLAHRGRGDHRSGGSAMHRISRLIPEAAGGIMTADDDNAVLAALVRSLGSHSAGRREDVGDVAGRAAFAVAVRRRHFLTRIVLRAMALLFAAATAHADDSAKIAKAVVRAFAFAVAATIAATAPIAAAAVVPNDGRAVVVAFVAVAAAVTFRIRGSRAPAARAVA